MLFGWPVGSTPRHHQHPHMATASLQHAPILAFCAAALVSLLSPPPPAAPPFAVRPAAVRFHERSASGARNASVLVEGSPLSGGCEVRRTRDCTA
jgi:hypothetical protein